MNVLRVSQKALLHAKYRSPARPYAACQLCGKYPATDHHEIVNRAYIDPDKLPIELHTLLCNACNLNNGEIKAESHIGRRLLTQKACMKWGIEAVLVAWESFCYGTRLPADIVEIFEDLYNVYIQASSSSRQTITHFSLRTTEDREDTRSIDVSS